MPAASDFLPAGQDARAMPGARTERVITLIKQMPREGVNFLQFEDGSWGKKNGQKGGKPFLQEMKQKRGIDGRWRMGNGNENGLGAIMNCCL